MNNESFMKDVYMTNNTSKYGGGIFSLNSDFSIR